MRSKSNVNGFNRVQVGTGIVKRPNKPATEIMSGVVTLASKEANRGKALHLSESQALRNALNGLEPWHTKAEREAAERVVRNLYAAVAA